MTWVLRQLDYRNKKILWNQFEINSTESDTLKFCNVFSQPYTFTYLPDDTVFAWMLQSIWETNKRILSQQERYKLFIDAWRFRSEFEHCELLVDAPCFLVPLAFFSHFGTLPVSQIKSQLSMSKCLPQARIMLMWAKLAFWQLMLSR